MDFDRILDRVFVGSYPDSAADVDRLSGELGVTAVLNLQTDEDAARLGVSWPRLQLRYRQSGIELRRVPVGDFDPEDLQEKLPQCVAVLDQLLQAGHTVYVHCTAGAGRSPNTVIAYLHWVEHWDLEEAVDHVGRRRRCVPDREAIRAAGRVYRSGFGHGDED